MLELKNVSLRIGQFELQDVSLNIQRGEYYVILGLSGAGKSILLECIAGMKLPYQGNVIMDGVDITFEKIQKRNIGYVFQDHAVFPHMNVYDNVAYALKRNHSKTDIRDKVQEVAKIVNIQHLLNRQPTTLSGGESQRVALARTLIRDPNYILLDEPFASLDVQLRDDLRALLRKLNRMGKTIIHVTHDYEEAISLAQKIAVFQDGKIIQQGNPFDVFSNPVSEFVARFRGIRNFFPVKMKSKNTVIFNDKITIEIPSQKMISSGYLMINSQDVSITKSRNEAISSNQFRGIITDVIPNFKGNEISIKSDLHLTSFINHRSFKQLNIKIGDEVWASIHPKNIKYLKSN